MFEDVNINSIPDVRRALSNVNNILPDHMKFGLVLSHLIKPNAAIRIGSSIISHNTTGGLDMVVEDNFISFFPGIEAVYTMPRNPEIDKDTYADVDALATILETPEQGLNVARVYPSAYLMIVHDAYDLTEGDSDGFRLIYQNKSNVTGQKQCLDFTDPQFGNNYFFNSLGISLFPKVRAVYFMSKTAWIEEADSNEGNWSNWWHFFNRALNLEIITMQYASAGITWWTYNTKAYSNLCKEYDFDPVQFKISPLEANFG